MNYLKLLEIPYLLIKVLIFSTFTVECEAGTFEHNGKCHLCPIGKYQGLPGKSNCVSCKENEVTKESGATGKEQCTPPGKDFYSLNITVYFSLQKLSVSSLMFLKSLLAFVSMQQIQTSPEF